MPQVLLRHDSERHWMRSAPARRVEFIVAAIEAGIWGRAD